MGGSNRAIGSTGFNPWRRPLHPKRDTQLTEDEAHYFHNLAEETPKFRELGGNDYFDFESKIAALKASPSVVALASYSGGEELYQCSGIIVEADVENIISVITNANLVRRPSTKRYAENSLADDLKVVAHSSLHDSLECEILVCDFHCNLLMLKFKSPVPLAVATFRRIDDGLRFNVEEETTFFRPHPHSMKLQPGDYLIAVGRYFSKPYELMMAPGMFSAERTCFDFKELFLVTCNISRCGDGAPLVNLSGEVIGITFHHPGALTHFLPINMAMKWWSHYKTYKKLCNPRMGFEAANLYLVDIGRMDKLIRKFPSICGGVIVEKITPGSSADSAGLQQDDIIVKCDGTTVESLLEVLEALWDKVGEVVELVVARDDRLITLQMVVAEAKSDELNRWTLWKH